MDQGWRNQIQNQQPGYDRDAASFAEVPRDDPDRDVYSKYDDQIKKLEEEDARNMARLQREDAKYPVSLLQEADPSSADPPPAASTLEQALREFKPVGPATASVASQFKEMDALQDRILER